MGALIACTLLSSLHLSRPVQRPDTGIRAEEIEPGRLASLFASGRITHALVVAFYHFHCYRQRPDWPAESSR
jgi:hypothetical protein